MNEAEKLINSLYGKGTIGFTCDSCGREVNGCSIVNGMTFCAKCYQETFGKDNQQNEIQQLKQKLAEKDIRIEELEGQFAYECECNKQLVELQKQLAEKDKEIKSLIVDYEKRISQEQELMSNMEHQLAEKQKTIDEINKAFVQAVHDWKTLCAEKDEEIERLSHYNNKLAQGIYWGNGEQFVDVVKKLKQNQTQLAIQELEKVKELVKDKSAWQSPFGLLKIQESDVEQIIDQQINDLRGE